MTLPAMKPARIQTLMMIDDSDIDQMIYKRIVSRSPIVDQLVQFTEAKDALEYLKTGQGAMPDVILLDVNMPGMNGFEFLEKATAELDARLCPVIVMLTTSLNPIDEAKARSYDIVRDFFNKPLNQKMLEALADLIEAD